MLRCRGALVSSRSQSFSRDLYIIEGVSSLARDLHFFVTLPREEDDVAGACLIDGQLNRLSTVDLDNVLRSGLLQTDEGVVDDRRRILAARIIRGKHDVVASSTGSVAHQRAFGTIAIASAAEQSDHPGRTAVARYKLTSKRC